MHPRELLGRLRDRLRRDRLSAELEEEVRYHAALLARDGVGSAGAPRAFGNATYYREETRTMWNLGWFDDFLDDVRYATRVLRRDPAFTAAVAVMLALGIGANAAVFSVVNAVLLRELPYAEPDRLVSIWTSAAATPTDRNPTSLPDLRDWQRQARSFTGVAGYGFNRYDATAPHGETQARGIQATGNLYDVLRASPILGRMPRADEETAPVVAISYRLWHDLYAGDSGVIGQTIRLYRQPYTIVGVLPRGFHFPTPDIDLWGTLYPIVSSSSSPSENPWLTSRSLRGYRVVARLAPGAERTTAEREMNAIEHRLALTYPNIDGGVDIHLESVRDDAVGKVRRALWTIFGAAGLVLLLACVNVAHLLLARLSTRSRELAVRRALGAHRGRLTRQLATESLVLAFLGGAAGVGLAFAALRVLLRLAPADIPRLENVTVDAQTLSFALVLSVATAFLFGVVPGLLGWRGDLHASLRGHGRAAAGDAHRTRAALTAIEVAFAVLLLVGAGLMLRSFAALTSTDIGVRPAGVTVAQLTMVGPRYEAGEAKSRAVESVLTSLRTTPGVEMAGASTSMPPSRLQEIESFTITGDAPPKPGHEPTAIYIPATTGFTEALGIPLLRGRGFDRRDGAATPPVVVISRELVRRHFANVEPIGRQLDVNGQSRTIIGVVGDALYEGVGTPVSPVMYVPYAQAPFPGVWIAIRSSRPASALAGDIRAAIQSVDPELPAHAPMPLDAMIAESVLRPRFHTWLLGTFGGLALLLATIGIYSVVAYGVASRRSELGIRLALGAPAGAIVRLVVGGAMVPVIGGLAVGLGLAYAGSRVLAGLLYGVTPSDTVTFVGVALVLAAAGVVAAMIPAGRAAHIDPLTATRGE